jgi:hypothetical protein
MVVLLLESVTTRPPGPAGLLTVAVPAEVLPPVTPAGTSEIELSTGTGFTVSVAVFVTPLYTAEIVTDVDVVTTVVVTVNVAEVAPWATVTLAGTEAAVVFELDSVTVMPPAGAAWLSVTVPVEALPPITVLGLTETDESWSTPETTSKVADAVPMPK